MSIAFNTRTYQNYTLGSRAAGPRSATIATESVNSGEGVATETLGCCNFGTSCHSFTYSCLSCSIAAIPATCCVSAVSALEMLLQ